MTYKDGEETQLKCKKCGSKMIYEMSFQDCYSYSSGHYTIDCPILYCKKCDIAIDYIGDEYTTGEDENKEDGIIWN
jgi:hypothetical protein